MELNQLETFLAVAEERSFSRAAVRLHRTQPAVSQVIRKLEESVGETLFDRAARDGSLTAAGVLLRDYAQRLLALKMCIRDSSRTAAREKLRSSATARKVSSWLSSMALLGNAEIRDQRSENRYQALRAQNPNVASPREEKLTTDH